MRVPKLAVHSSGQFCVRIRKQSFYLGRDRKAATTQYRELIAEHYGAAGTGHYPQPSGAASISVTDLLSRYQADQLRLCPERWRQKRIDKYKQVFPVVESFYGELPAIGFGPACLVTIRRKLAAVDGRCRGYVNDLARKVKAAFKWGVWNELVPLDTYTRLAMVPDLKRGELGLGEGRQQQAAAPEIVEAILPFLNDRNRDLVRLLQLTAARPDEIVRLRPGDWRVKDGVWVYAPAEHKMSHANRRRLIVFNAEAQAILWKYIDGERDGWLFPADLAQAPGEHYRVSSLRNAITSACHRAGVPRFTPYSLRHLAITTASIKYGADVAQALAGHASQKTTAIYDHSELAKIRKAVG